LFSNAPLFLAGHYVTPLEILEQFLVDQLLPPQAREQHRAGDISHATLLPFAQALKRISAAYTEHTAGRLLRQPVIAASDAEAYALYYTLINAAKVATLTRLVSLPKEASVLDVGCGPGTAFLSLLATRSESFNFTGIETSPAMRSVAQKLLGAWSERERLREVALDSSIARLDTRQYDLVLAANVLAETSSEQGRDMTLNLARKVKPGGALILIEPGQLLHTRRLMELRNLVLSELSSFAPIFPCTRSDDCPMLSTSESDWCHGTLRWERPRLVRQLDELLGFNKHRIKYSGFVFVNGGDLVEGHRVVSAPEKGPGGTTAILCGLEYYGPVRIRKGQRSDQNRPLEKADVYDRLLFSRPVSADIYRSTAVQVVADGDTVNKDG
jgi:SAM-dependent methyltransferase